MNEPRWRSDHRSMSRSVTPFDRFSPSQSITPFNSGSPSTLRRSRISTANVNASNGDGNIKRKTDRRQDHEGYFSAFRRFLSILSLLLHIGMYCFIVYSILEYYKIEYPISSFQKVFDKQDEPSLKPPVPKSPDLEQPMPNTMTNEKPLPAVGSDYALSSYQNILNAFFRWPDPKATLIPISQLTHQLALTFGEDFLHSFPSKHEMKDFTIAASVWPMSIPDSEADAVLLASMKDLAKLDSNFEDAMSTMETRLANLYKQISRRIMPEWEKEKNEKRKLPTQGGMIEGIQTSTKIKSQMMPYVNGMVESLEEMNSFLSLVNATLARPKTYCSLGETKALNTITGEVSQQTPPEIPICPKKLIIFLENWEKIFSNYKVNLEIKLPEVKSFNQRLSDGAIQVHVSLVGDAYVYPWSDNYRLDKEIQLMDTALIMLKTTELKFFERQK